MRHRKEQQLKQHPENNSKARKHRLQHKSGNEKYGFFKEKKLTTDNKF